MIKESLKRLWNDDRGQSTTEYILILSVVVMVAMKFRNTFGKSLDKLIATTDKQIYDAVADSDSSPN